MVLEVKQPVLNTKGPERAVGVWADAATGTVAFCSGLVGFQTVVRIIRDAGFSGLVVFEAQTEANGLNKELDFLKIEY